MPRTIRKATWPVLASALIGISTVSMAFATDGSRWFTAAGGSHPFAQPLAMNDEAYDRFILGRSFFSTPWVEAPSATSARDGLGPHFNANTCASCHEGNGSAPTLGADGKPLRPLLFKLGQPSRHATRRSVDNIETPFHDRVPDPVYGAQIAINGNGKVKPEAAAGLKVETVPFAYPDGTKRNLTRLRPRLSRLAYGPLAPETHVALRQPPALAGLGLIEDVPDAEILAWADPDDRNGDGISGRPNWVRVPPLAAPRLGRFNWKASEPSVLAQVANAAALDMGLTNSAYPKELCQPAQRDCLAAPRGVATPEGDLDLPDTRLQAIAAYVESFKAPQSKTGAFSAEAKAGREIFADIGCTACHRTTLTTRDGVAFHPFTDLLLHDMGPDLGDDIPSQEATASEFRTAPLWGLGARSRAGDRFLHDARAATPEEAILWHGGEAKAARDRFVHLDRALRAALLHYLEML